MVTIVVTTLLLGATLVSALLWALFLRVGLRWAKTPDVTTRRVALATVLVVIFQLAMTIALLLISPNGSAPTLMFVIMELAVAVLVPCFIIVRVFKVSSFRAVQAWLPTILAPIITLAVILFVFRPFLVEAFVIPTNSMAPTVLGYHYQGTCTQCGSPAFGSATGWQYGPSDRPPLMICRDNFHVMQPTDYSHQVLGRDRILVAKFVKPRRWDLIVFRYPEDPSTSYLKRLVGLPGEEIVIKDGQVWTNGKKLTPPDSIRGIEYLSEMPDGYGGKLWGSPDMPAKLGPDEYFVLGDFSALAKDSRFWQSGAPGHNPFAVPQSYLQGVVTNTYWPPSRWRTFR